MEENNIAWIGGRRVALIRIPKCASRSMAAALGLRVAGYHVPRRWIEARDAGNPMYLACVRPPLDRLVSWHAYHAERDPGIYVGAGVLGFREWVRCGCPHRFPMTVPEMHPWEQWRWIEGVRGELRLLRFDRLAEDWARLSRSMAGLGELRVSNTSDHGDPAEYYDHETRRRAEAICWNDLRRFCWD